jgi:hypothetical protein
MLREGEERGVHPGALHALFVVFQTIDIHLDVVALIHTETLFA